MKSITVILNEHSRYTIDLKDEYKLDEFIKFFEAEMHIVKGYRLDSPVAGVSERGTPTKVTSGDAAEIMEDDC